MQNNGPSYAGYLARGTFVCRGTYETPDHFVKNTIHSITKKKLGSLIKVGDKSFFFKTNIYDSYFLFSPVI